MKHLLNASEYAFLHDPRATRGQLCYLTVAGSPAYAHSPLLPPKPDQQAVDNLLLRIYRER